MLAHQVHKLYVCSIHENVNKSTCKYRYKENPKAASECLPRLLFKLFRHTLLQLFPSKATVTQSGLYTISHLGFSCNNNASQRTLQSQNHLYFFLLAKSFVLDTTLTKKYSRFHLRLPCEEP